MGPKVPFPKHLDKLLMIGNIFLCNIKTIEDIKFQKTEEKQ
jgi:hypothetical protein